MKIKLLPLFKFLFFISALSSYALLGIPIQWLGLAFSCAIFILMLFKKNFLISKIHLPLYLFVMWSFFVTLISMPFNTFPMPSLATSGYEIFIFLRLLKLIAFLSIFIITIKVMEIYGYRNITKHIINLGFFIAIYSFYTYFATLYNLPELPRNRLGTGGAEAVTSFTYDFHRATGTFLEPSHLGEWLSLPFLLSFIIQERLIIFKRVTMGIVILLTGSFGTILSIILGLCLTVLILLVDLRRNALMLSMLKYIFVATLLIIISFLLINILLSGIFIDQLGERLSSLTEFGLVGSNRGYVYLFLANNPVPITGYGLGFSNLFLTNISGGTAMMSFLSLYINTLYSSGIIGFIILIVALFYPLFLIIINSSRNKKSDVFYIVWAYITLLILFIVNMEELTVTFAISYASVINLLNTKKHAL